MAGTGGVEGFGLGGGVKAEAPHHLAVWDLLRKRSQLVRQKVMRILSMENLFSRNTGARLSADQIRRLTDAEVEQLLPQADLALAVKSSK